MAAGEDVSSPSTPRPAVLYSLGDEATMQLGDEIVYAQYGSFVFMPLMLPHAIAARSPVEMLLVQIMAKPERVCTDKRYLRSPRLEIAST